jgi:hypothetical protein
MKYNFSSHFLKVGPADGTFGNAWEALCFDLLRASAPSPGWQRLNAPDGGVDILHRIQRHAYQCKATDDGAGGTVPSAESVKSLEAAVAGREVMPWTKYHFATNANYSGAGSKAIEAKAKELVIPVSDIVHLGLEHWSDLCETHYDKVKHRLDYRLTVSEHEVIEALRLKKFYESYVCKFVGRVQDRGQLITNNRTSVELELPVSPDMTVKDCLNVAMAICDLELKGQTFPDLETSYQPSYSMTVGKKPQPFSTAISALPEATEGLELWIKVIWKDESSDDPNVIKRHVGLSGIGSRIPVVDRGAETVRRAVGHIQDRIWAGIAGLLGRRQSRRG